MLVFHGSCAMREQDGKKMVHNTRKHKSEGLSFLGRQPTEKCPSNILEKNLQSDIQSNILHFKQCDNKPPKKELFKGKTNKHKILNQGCLFIGQTQNKQK